MFKLFFLQWMRRRRGKLMLASFFYEKGLKF
jgi:hypothetical protein